MAQPGDIVVVDFPGVQGIKRRSAMVVTSDQYHRLRPDVIVGVITSQLPSNLNPTDHVLADWKSAGLAKPSVFRVFLATLPKKSIVSTIGRASAADWAAVQACVRVGLAI